MKPIIQSAQPSPVKNRVTHQFMMRQKANRLRCHTRNQKLDLKRIIPILLPTTIGIRSFQFKILQLGVLKHLLHIRLLRKGLERSLKNSFNGFGRIDAENRVPNNLGAIGIETCNVGCSSEVGLTDGPVAVGVGVVV